jgi:hypothetical protein
MPQRASNIVVAAADEKYAPLLRDLLDSLEPHRANLAFDIAVLDLGLDERTREEFASRVEHLVTPQWPFKPHPQFDADRRYLSRAARPFLPELIRGYAVYVWLDADTWVQRPLGLRWLIDAPKGVDLAAVPTIHPAYKFTDRDRSWLYKRYRMGFGDALARELSSRPYVNTGAFAARAGSRLWRCYAARFQTALDRWDGPFLSDQAVINATIRYDLLAMRPLPAKANWLCHLAPPLWDAATGLLVEPVSPFEPLLIVHNTFDDKTREWPLKTTTGQPHKTRLTRSGIQALSATPTASSQSSDSAARQSSDGSTGNAG